MLRHDSIHPDARPLTLTSALTRSIGHRLRTPLSIISNELQYLKRLLPAQESDRAIEACSTIARILKEFDLASSESQRCDTVSCVSLLSAAQIPIPVIPEELEASSICGATEGILLSLKICRQLLPAENLSPQASISSGQLQINFTDRSTLSTDFEFTSLTELCGSKAPELIESAIWADAALWRAGGELLIKADKIETLQMNIPVLDA